MFGGFNKGFSLGFAGRVFNRGLSTKILSIERLTEVIQDPVEEVVEEATVISTSPFMLSEAGIYNVDLTSLGGATYIIIQADASLFNGQEITLKRIDANIGTSSTVYYNNSQQQTTLGTSQTITFISNGISWSISVGSIGDGGLPGPGSPPPP